MHSVRCVPSRAAAAGLTRSGIAPLHYEYDSLFAKSAMPVKRMSHQARTATRVTSGQAWEEKYGKSLEFGVSAAQGLRDEMEDVAAVVPKGTNGFFFAGVFDGHAGASVSQYLAENLYGRISEAIDSMGVEEESRELAAALERVFQDVDSDVLAWLNDGNGPPAEAGSTATCILARKDKVVVANVGDSRAVMCKAGSAVELSTEHRCYGKGNIVKEETARIKAAGGWVKNGRVCDMLAVTRAFGDAEFKGKENLERLLEMGVREKYWSKDFADGITFTGDPVVAAPDVSEVSVELDDEFIIVATDGLWDVYPSNEAVSLVRRECKASSSAQDIADLLVDRAIKRKTQDNVSVAIIFLKDASELRQNQTIKSPAKVRKGVFGMFG